MFARLSCVRISHTLLHVRLYFDIIINPTFKYFMTVSLKAKFFFAAVTWTTNSFLLKYKLVHEIFYEFTRKLTFFLSGAS